MIVTFFSNFFNHHQKPICDFFYKELGNDFRFVSSLPMPERFSKAGYQNLTDIKYNLLSYESQENYQEAKRLGDESDIVIFGTAPIEFILDRIRANKHTFRYSERFFKKGTYQKLDYRIIIHLLKYHTRYRKKNVYMLCASAFTANDFNWVKAYPNKLFKWGYFTKVEILNIQKIIQNRKYEPIKILFVSRLIKWKHPELVIQMAAKLKIKNIPFELRIIGSGELEESLKKESSLLGLDNNVVFLNNLSNQEVVERMRSSNIFVFTSNRHEGWGAVLNEAMSNGCAVVASNKIGSAPFLIKPGENGLIFKSEDANDLTLQVEKLILDKNLRDKLSLNAYKTMVDLWSPEKASEVFLRFCKSLLEEKKIIIQEGPCSIAIPTSNNWHL